jgi:hypothetical protein
LIDGFLESPPKSAALAVEVIPGDYIMMALMPTVERLKKWVAAIPIERRRGEWECDYDGFQDLYNAVISFVGTVPLAKWKPEEVSAVLFAVARDNEDQYLAHEIACIRPETLVALAAAAIEKRERDAKWQLAEELGHFAGDHSTAEHLLITLAHDEAEYVRRRSLKSLARLGSAAVEELALGEWQRADQNQEYARMSVLWCLHCVNSPHLPPLLLDAEKDERHYLSEYAKKVQRGEVEP